MGMWVLPLVNVPSSEFVPSLEFGLGAKCIRNALIEQCLEHLFHQSREVVVDADAGVEGDAFWK